MVRVIMVFLGLCLASQAIAQEEMTEAQKRKIVVPYIRNLTYCIINYALGDFEAVAAYRDNTFQGYLQTLIKKCPTQFDALADKYEATYGEGTTFPFINGPYADSLPQVVLQRIKPKMDERLAAYNQAKQKADLETQQKNEAERAEAEREADQRRQRDEERRAEIAKAEADRKAAEAKAAQQKHEQLDTAKRSMYVIRDKFYALRSARRESLRRFSWSRVATAPH